MKQKPLDGKLHESIQLKLKYILDVREVNKKQHISKLFRLVLYRFQSQSEQLILL